MPHTGARCRLQRAPLQRGIRARSRHAPPARANSTEARAARAGTHAALRRAKMMPVPAAMPSPRQDLIWPAMITPPRKDCGKQRYSICCLSPCHAPRAARCSPPHATVAPICHGQRRCARENDAAMLPARRDTRARWRLKVRWLYALRCACVVMSPPPFVRQRQAVLMRYATRIARGCGVPRLMPHSGTHSWRIAPDMFTRHAAMPMFCAATRRVPSSAKCAPAYARASALPRAVRDTCRRRNAIPIIVAICSR